MVLKTSKERPKKMKIKKTKRTVKYVIKRGEVQKEEEIL